MFILAPLDQEGPSTPEQTGSPLERGRESAEPAEASVPAAVQSAEADAGQAAPPPSPPNASTPPAARVSVDDVVFKTPIVAATPGSRARGKSEHFCCLLKFF